MDLLDLVKVCTLSIIEQHPAFVGKLIRIPTASCIREAYLAHLLIFDMLVMLVSKLLSHKVIAKGLNSWRDHYKSG